MGASNETIHVEMKFSDRALAQPLLRRIESIPNLVLTIVRGRVTPADARFELELTGTSRKVAQVVRMSRDSGIDVRMWTATPSCASTLC